MPISDIVEMEDRDPLLELMAGHLDYYRRHKNGWDVWLTCLKSVPENASEIFCFKPCEHDNTSELSSSS